MILAIYIDRESKDVRSSGDSRKRVDAYYVLYRCPADKVNPCGTHDWICKFEIDRGSTFVMRDYESKKEAKANCGYIL